MSESGIALMVLLADLLTLSGSVFFLISAIGLLRLPDFFCRVHAPTKAGTLGILLLSLGAVLRSLAQGNLLWLEELAVLVFLALTIPVTSQVLARSALKRRLVQTPRSTGMSADEPEG